MIATLRGTGGVPIGAITYGDSNQLASVLTWHPTEATALVASSARGVRGYLAMRRGRKPVPITSHSPKVWETLPSGPEVFPLAQLLTETLNLSDAEEIMRAAAVNEIDFERTAVAAIGGESSGMSLAGVVDELVASGATHITARRLHESLSRQCRRELDEFFDGLSVGLVSVDELCRFAGQAI